MIIYHWSYYIRAWNKDLKLVGRLLKKGKYYVSISSLQMYSKFFLANHDAEIGWKMANGRLLF